MPVLSMKCFYYAYYACAMLTVPKICPRCMYYAYYACTMPTMPTYNNPKIKTVLQSTQQQNIIYYSFLKIMRLINSLFFKFEFRNFCFSSSSLAKQAEFICFLFLFICHIFPPFTRKQIVSLCFGRCVCTRLGFAISKVSGPPVFHIKVGRPVKCLAQGHNKRTCLLVLHNLL